MLALRHELSAVATATPPSAQTAIRPRWFRAVTSRASRSRHRFRRATVALLAGGVLAAILTATSGEYASESLQVVGPATVLVGLIALGRAAGWSSIPLMTVCVLLAGWVGSAFFYDHQADVPPDLRVSGMDEIGRNPASVVLLLPFVWTVLVLAIVSCLFGRRTSADR